jgi:ABC-type Zn2+ transport system substrate-binding protein/surface adhesin
MDSMIWAANGEDMFAGYHGESRGVVYIEWSEGVAILKQEEEEEETDDVEDGHDEDGHTHEEDESDHSSSAVSMANIDMFLIAVSLAYAATVAVM